MLTWFVLILVCFSSGLMANAETLEPAPLREVVYVESNFDTDGDGAFDRIYLSIERQVGTKKLPTILKMSPYAMGLNRVKFHSVEVEELPQNSQDDEKFVDDAQAFSLKSFAADFKLQALRRGYASISAHSLGTGKSTGCPTVGDRYETLAAKAVVDWLNGRARGYDEAGKAVTASWATGNVGMIGVSYNGTLPNMVATTAVEGLKAIIPIAAISNWYDYYRANGLVVGPGGYVGEDADILAKAIVRKGRCRAEIDRIAKDMGRSHGDYTRFWQERDYLPKADQVKAAVFIVHGQSDWNVRQRHAIEWWRALEGYTPLRMWLHRGGHSSPSRQDFNKETWAWFDRYVKGEKNGVENKAAIEVQHADGKWHEQQKWPHEKTQKRRYYFAKNQLSLTQPTKLSRERLRDTGRTTRSTSYMKTLTQKMDGRIVLLSQPFPREMILSGTTKMTVKIALQNKHASNLSIILAEQKKGGGVSLISRGWADPQNFKDLTHGEKLKIGAPYTVSFDLEPKQYQMSSGSRLAVILFATDREHTLRPKEGTILDIYYGGMSYLDAMLGEF